MHILINGGTGFIGSKLCERFLKLGYQVDILTRGLGECPNVSSSICYKTELDDPTLCYDVIINLSGEPLNKRRWNTDVKNDILSSRVQSTLKIIEFIATCHTKPKLFISGSAIGFYGHSSDLIFREDTPPARDEFIHRLCAEWEDAALKAEEYGVRVCLIRTGIVLDKSHGALAEMLLPFKLGLGAQLGQGTQWMSWVHIADVIGAIEFLIDREDLSGPVNLTSPGVVKNKDFTQTLAKVLNRPSFLTLPSPVVKLMFGEMGEALLLHGQNVIPQKLVDAGYKIKFTVLDTALENILYYTESD